MESRGAVVVGVDGSESDYRAAEWAAGEAFRQGVALRVLHCSPSEPAASLQDPAEARARRQASPVLAEAVDRARAITGGAGVVTVQAPLAVEAPARKLVVESHYASLLVVGGRGHHGVATLVLGSTAAYAAAHARCPVMVVREGAATKPGAPVLVGVEASAASQAVLEFAFSCAAARGVGLVALHAWHLSRGVRASPKGVGTVEAEHQEAAARGKLAEALRPWQQLCSQVPVEHRLVQGSAVASLVAASHQDVEAVVVGSRGLAARAGMLLGSVSQGVLRRADRPVMIAR